MNSVLTSPAEASAPATCPPAPRASFAQQVLTHLTTLAHLSPDGVAHRNDVGFSGATLGPGRRLLRTFPDWTAEDLESARWICNVHARQLDLERDEFNDLWEASGIAEEVAHLRRLAAEAARERAAKELADSATADCPFGLRFPAWRTVNTSRGARKVRSAAPTAAFWEAWRNTKEQVKAQGFSVGRAYRDPSAWEVTQWGELAGADTPPASKPVALAELPVEAPAPLANPAGLLSYQVPHAAALAAALRRVGAALDASDTGTGKTYAALAVFRELGVSPLVVAPKAVLTAWQRAAGHMGVTLAGVINYEALRTGNTPWGQWVGEGKAEVFQFAGSVTGLVFDEAHRCKGTDTQNAYLLRAARDQGIPTLASSATVGHSPLEMRALGHLIGLTRWGSFWGWARAHGCAENRWGGLDFSGSRAVLEGIHRQIFPRAGSRMRIADLGDAFPETQIAAESYSANGAAAEIDRIHGEMERELAALAERAGRDSADSRAAAMVAMLRARQRAELVKVPLFAELVADAVENGQSVALFVCFRETLSAVSERLGKAGIAAGQIHGEQTAAERQAAIDAFQEDRSHVIVAMLAAGGVGISLHDVRGERSRIAFISPTWSAVELRQALGRVHRAGGKSKSLQRIVFVAGSVEDRVRGIVGGKLARLDTLNDGDLGRPAGVAEGAPGA